MCVCKKKTMVVNYSELDSFPPSYIEENVNRAAEHQNLRKLIAKYSFLREERPIAAFEASEKLCVGVSNSLVTCLTY